MGLRRSISVWLPLFSSPHPIQYPHPHPSGRASRPRQIDKGGPQTQGRMSSPPPFLFSPSAMLNGPGNEGGSVGIWASPPRISSLSGTPKWTSHRGGAQRTGGDVLPLSPPFPSFPSISILISGADVPPLPPSLFRSVGWRRQVCSVGLSLLLPLYPCFPRVCCACLPSQ